MLVSCYFFLNSISSRCFKVQINEFLEAALAGATIEVAKKEESSARGALLKNWDFHNNT